MLSEHEQRVFREIQEQLSEHSDFGRSARPTEPVSSRTWQRLFHAVVIGAVALLTIVMVMSGLFGGAVLLIAAAMTLVLVNEIGTDTPGGTSFENDEDNDA